jgi:hypothetical protein
VQRTTWRSALFCFGLLCLAGVEAHGARPSESLLPASTKGWVSVEEVDKLSENWGRTQFGQMLGDPEMEQFAEDLRSRLEGKWSGLSDDFGIELEDIEGTAAGAASLAVTQGEGVAPAMLLMIDVGETREKVDALIAKIDKKLRERGAKVSKKAIRKTDVSIYNLPKDKQRAGSSGLVVYCVKDNVLWAADQVAALEDILARASSEAADSLDKLPAFQAVMQRCKQGAGDLVPQVRWFAEPLGLASALQILYPPKEPQDQDMVKVLKTEGFDAIKGVGGFLNLTVGQYDLLHRTAIFAPPPYQRSMRMLVFPNVETMAPPAWLPGDIATFTTANVDIQTAFKYCGTLFDQTIGEGEEGVFEDTLDSIRDDPEGPGIDIRKDLVTHLGTRVMLATDYELPVTLDSERILIGVETTNPSAMAIAIEKSMKSDPSVQRREIGGFVVWEIQEEAPEHEAPVVEFADPVGFDDPAALPKGAEGEAGGGVKLGEGGRVLPHSAITVAYDHVLVCSHIDLLERVLTQQQSEAEQLGAAEDYKKVMAELEKLGATSTAVEMFRRTDQEHNVTYELMREGKLPQAKTMVARILNATLGGTEEKPREVQVDGSRMPPFEAVKKYFGPAGLYMTSEENGWYMTGFTLRNDPGVVAEARTEGVETASPSEPAKSR